MKYIIFLLTLFVIGCNSPKRAVTETSLSCPKLTLIKRDSLSYDITNNILQLVSDSVVTLKNDSYNEETFKNINVDTTLVGVLSDSGNVAQLFEYKDIVIIDDYFLNIFHKKLKKCFNITGLKFKTSLKELYCHNRYLIFRIPMELYDTYYRRDLYFIIDDKLNSVKAFAVPILQETAGIPQPFKFESISNLVQQKDGNLVIHMDMQIIHNEETKETFKVDIPFNEETGTFMDLNKILPLLSPYIPISDTNNIVIQDLSKPNK